MHFLLAFHRVGRDDLLPPSNSPTHSCVCNYLLTTPSPGLASNSPRPTPSLVKVHVPPGKRKGGRANSGSKRGAAKGAKGGKAMGARSKGRKHKAGLGSTSARSISKPAKQSAPYGTVSFAAAGGAYSASTRGDARAVYAGGGNYSADMSPSARLQRLGSCSSRRSHSRRPDSAASRSTSQALPVIVKRAGLLRLCVGWGSAGASRWIGACGSERAASWLADRGLPI